MNDERLSQQIQFLVEVDKLKQVLRQNVVTGSRRQENDAEHSWHLALMAPILAEYAAEKVDVLRVMQMVLIHDLVEIDAGDTFAYDKQGYEDKDEREQKAANRIFNILPSDQAREIMNLWREFEEMQTPEARFAAVLDRLQPLLLNYHTEGHTWKKPGVTSKDVYKRNEVAKESTPLLGEYIKEIIEDSIKKGILKE